MSAEEKSAMHARVFGVPTAAPHTSPYVFVGLRSWQLRVLAPLAIVLLIGSGTSFAAEGALPGDTLYPVKVYVNEGVALSLARSSKAKAEAHAALAERRVAEAQALAAEGRLDATTTEALAVGLEAHIEDAEAEATMADEDEAGKGREVREKLAVTIDTGARVLARLGEGKDRGTRESTKALSVRLLARADTGAAGTVNAFAKAAPAADVSATMSLSVMAEGSAMAEDPAAQKEVASLEHEAAEALDEARDIFDKVQESLSDEVLEDLEKEFSAIETSMSLGSASLGAGAYAQAEADFTDALRLATKLGSLLKAHQKFDGDLIGPLLKSNHYEGDGHDHGGNEDDDDDLRNQVEILVPRL